MKRLLPRPRSVTSHERGVLVATCLSSLGSFYTMAVTGFALPQIQHGLSIPEDELFPTAFRSTAAGVREAVGTVGASLGLWILSLLYAATASHPASITWLLLLTPISPLIILFIPETARRELEEIAPN